MNDSNKQTGYTIIISGSEILSGKRQDRHIHYLTRSLLPLGLHCERCELIGDEKTHLENSVRRALSGNDLVIVTGGLGPTVDDITRETIAEAMEIPLAEHPDALKMLKDRFRSFGKSMTENNRRQTLVPVHGSFIPNPNGTAPGLIYDHNEKIAIALPGPPRELEPMVRESLIPFLQNRLRLHDQTTSVVLRFCGIGESNVDWAIRDIVKDVPGLNISLLHQIGIIELTLSLPSDSPEAKSTLDNLSQRIQEAMEPCCYSVRQETLEEVIGKSLRERNETLSIAESCTGGLLGAKIVSTPGASSYFKGGVISYSNEIKKKLVGVQQKTLDEHGAVSKETVCEMANGVRESFQSDWGVAITGIAGPEGGTPEKPVGQVWIAVSNKDGSVYPFKAQMPGNRDSIRERSCVYALDQLRRLLLNKTIYK